MIFNGMRVETSKDMASMSDFYRLSVCYGLHRGNDIGTMMFMIKDGDRLSELVKVFRAMADELDKL